MATSSITKEFVVKGSEAFERLKKELDSKSVMREKVAVYSSLKKGREKLSTFVFC